MFVSNFILKSGGLLGSGESRTNWQWQPITYGSSPSHDPNPPMILEDAPIIPPAGGNVLRMLMGVGV